MAEDNYKKLKSELDDKLNPSNPWKLKKRLCPNSRDPPCAMIDEDGNIQTSDKAIEDIAVKAYKERLSSNKIKDHLNNQIMKMMLTNSVKQG